MNELQILKKNALKRKKFQITNTNFLYLNSVIYETNFVFDMFCAGFRWEKKILKITGAELIIIKILNTNFRCKNIKETNSLKSYSEISVINIPKNNVIQHILFELFIIFLAFSLKKLIR